MTSYLVNNNPGETHTTPTITFMHKGTIGVHYPHCDALIKLCHFEQGRIQKFNAAILKLNAQSNTMFINCSRHAMYIKLDETDI